ncbi:MAG: dTDP-4-dehydrorhamnose 3,5-epimerase family protein [Tabrizicola sp.]|nr:dTDP-4-dehydrorhamnose 3,5-epimerase family protein [Tabrizicola sp.]
MRRLTQHADTRGVLAEIYRSDWTPSGAFLQWNLVRSAGNVLRGVHVHPCHADYLLVLSGTMLLGLHDLRPDDPATRTTLFLTLCGDEPSTVYIPPGVCHGFWFADPTTYVYGLSTTWNVSEELGCRYDDPDLRLDWPAAGPILSPRDTSPAHDYASMRAAWLAAQKTRSVA